MKKILSQVAKRKTGISNKPRRRMKISAYRYVNEPIELAPKTELIVRINIYGKIITCIGGSTKTYSKSAPIHFDKILSINRESGEGTCFVIPISDIGNGRIRKISEFEEI